MCGYIRYFLHNATYRCSRPLSLPGTFQASSLCWNHPRRPAQNQTSTRATEPLNKKIKKAWKAGRRSAVRCQEEGLSGGGGCSWWGLRSRADVLHHLHPTAAPFKPPSLRQPVTHNSEAKNKWKQRIKLGGRNIVFDFRSRLCVFLPSAHGLDPVCVLAMFVWEAILFSSSASGTTHKEKFILSRCKMKETQTPPFKIQT